MSNRRVRSHGNMILYTATDTYPRQYCAYTTWFANGHEDGDLMMRVYL